MTHPFCIAFDTRRLCTEDIAALARVFDAERGYFKRLLESTTVVELVGLATCNRFELYALGPETCVVRKGLLDALETESGRPWRKRHQAYVVIQEERAAEHLFRVACGIDSLVVGEREILGQVRRALDEATERGLVGDVLTRLFRRALATGRRARHDTAISRGNVSVASVSVDVAARALPDGIRGKRVALYGTGETAAGVLGCLSRHSPAEVIVVSRDHERAARIAASAANTRTAHREESRSVLANADVAFMATHAEQPIVAVDDLGARTAAQPLLLLDLSVPSAVDPAVRGLPNARVLSLHHFNEAARENLAQREGAVREVEAIITEAVAAWRAREREQSGRNLADEVFRALEARRREQLQRIGGALGEEQRAALDHATRSVLRGMMHDVSREVRSLTDSEEDALVRRLFGIPAASPPAETISESTESN